MSSCANYIAAAANTLSINSFSVLGLHGAPALASQEAVDELLELFRRDREWNDGAAKAQLFKIFDALSPKDPIALNGRRKLSSLIFA